MFYLFNKFENFPCQNFLFINPFSYFYNDTTFFSDMCSNETNFTKCNIFI